MRSIVCCAAAVVFACQPSRPAPVAAGPTSSPTQGPAASPAPDAGGASDETAIPVAVEDAASKEAGRPESFVVVSFGSDGTGIDAAAVREVGAAIERAEQSGKMKIFYRTVSWGKEGEIDYCLARSKRPSGAMRQLVRELEEIAARGSLVAVVNGGPCREGR